MDDYYELCKGCWHFVEDNDSDYQYFHAAPYIHLDDGEVEYDHDAEPSGVRYELITWSVNFPELFTIYADGKIGPNSTNFVGRNHP